MGRVAKDRNTVTGLGFHYEPMPANNGAYLDFGPQGYKVHLFGALFRYAL